MRYRVFLLLVTAFFVTMNTLLWRSEFGAHSRAGAPIPPEVVWGKVLTSPDTSSLELRHHGVKIGRASCSATIIGDEMATGRVMTDEVPPEGMLKRLIGYELDFDSSVSLDNLSRLRFSFGLKLDPNQTWQELNLKLTVKPFSWESHASAERRTIRVVTRDDEGTQERNYTFADLQNPEKILRELGGPELPAVLGALGALGRPLPLSSTAASTSGLNWEARNDRLKIGNNLIRVYRLEARLLDRYRATLFVSPVGEILRVELPDEIVFINDALMNL